MKNPYPAKRLDNIRLTGPDSDKDTRHHAISLGDSGIVYHPGDALGLIATNCPELARELVTALGAKGTEMVPDKNKQPKPLLDALIQDYVINFIDKKFVEAAVKKGISDLAPLIAPENADKLKIFLNGRDECFDYVDLLRAYPELKFAPEEFVALLRRLPPRLYSIASALSAHPNEVHLTVATVRYQIRGRQRKGVASSFLAERWSGVQTAGIYIQSQQKHFFLPPDGNTPIIMVGPGTGIAPFRGFIAHRLATGAKGKNWLFFGERRSSQDFFYREYFEKLIADGFLKMSLAWSRDVPGQRTFGTNQNARAWQRDLGMARARRRFFCLRRQVADGGEHRRRLAQNHLGTRRQNAGASEGICGSDEKSASLQARRLLRRRCRSSDERNLTRPIIDAYASIIGRHSVTRISRFFARGCSRG